MLLLDTTFTSTTATHVVDHVTFFRSLQGDLDPTHWFLLFGGLVFYWLKTLNATRIVAAGKPYLKDFWWDNWIELPTSIFACIILAVMAKSISTDLIDLHGVVSVFVVGYSSSSILNALITQGKPAIKNMSTTTKGAVSLIAFIFRGFL